MYTEREFLDERHNRNVSIYHSNTDFGCIADCVASERIYKWTIRDLGLGLGISSTK